MGMNGQVVLNPLLLFLLMIALWVPGNSFLAAAAEARRVTKLFVFGDSYADTGNWRQGSQPWNLPFGITFPGEPAGRFSDGRILTDFLASGFGLPSPVPYERRNSGGWKPRFGMNFAYGGTGVFETSVTLPNMTTQIDFFQQQIGPIYTKSDLLSSLAVVSLAGNDYVTYIRGAGGSSQQRWQDYAKSVINQLVMDLKRIRDLGVPEIGVTALEPIGCLPSFTVFLSYQNCTDSFNGVARYHNRLLAHRVHQLNVQAGRPVFFVLNLYDAFMSALKPGRGDKAFEDLLKPCCQGVSSQYKCGSREGDQAKYTVCSKPGSSFFWDSVHPAQRGWNQVYLAIRSSLPRM